jgi:hypothetical protein
VKYDHEYLEEPTVEYVMPTTVPIDDKDLPRRAIQYGNYEK